MWTAVVSFATKPTFFLTKVKRSPEKSLLQLHYCSDIPCELAGWDTAKKLIFMETAVSPEHLGGLSSPTAAHAVGIVSSCPSTTAWRVVYFWVRSRTESCHSRWLQISDSRLLSEKKGNPCCQRVYSLLIQSRTQGSSISNATVSFQQHWHKSKRFPLSQTGFVTSSNQTQFLYSFPYTHIFLFFDHLVQTVQQVGATWAKWKTTLKLPDKATARTHE